VVVKGTSDPDNIGLNGANGPVNVTGLPTAIEITQAEGGRDKLSVDGRGGADTFDPTGLAPNTIGFTFVSQPGADRRRPARGGPPTLLGGEW